MKKTPPEIRILADDVANKIAAGEVIERPAAAVKELLENAVDAGATRIEVEFRHGGKSFVKILDNGCGMTREQALMSLEAHATSKIRNPEDLFSISSFGFRGEALPSIASVSKFRMRTRPEGADFGTQIDVYAGEVKSVRECGMAEGTEILVENLFCSVPARRKFLKSDNVEASHISKLCRLYALALPELSITLIENSRVIFRSESGADVVGRVESVCGAELSGKLIELGTREVGGMKLGGAILAAGESFATSRNISAFINSRPVDCRAVYSAVKEAYAPYLPKGRFAAACLFIELDPASVDVNVHPAKREVRLKNEFAVRDFIYESISSRLAAYCSEKAGIPQKSECERQGNPVRESADALGNSEAVKIPPTPALRPSDFSSPVREGVPAEVFKIREPIAVLAPSRNAPLTEASDLSPAAPFASPAPIRSGDWRYIGCVKKRFAVFETPKAMVLMSISAALKRVHYARIIAGLKGRKPTSQSLLIPVTVSFERADAEFFEANRAAFEACGFSIEDFGRGCWRVAAVPAWLDGGQIENFIRDFVEECRAEEKSVRARSVGHEAFARLAVRRISAAGFSCDETSANALLSELLACEFHMTAPDGRPTLREVDVSG